MTLLIGAGLTWVAAAAGVTFGLSRVMRHDRPWDVEAATGRRHHAVH